MTQHGCAASAFTINVPRSWGVQKDTTTVTVTAPSSSASASLTSSPSTAQDAAAGVGEGRKVKRPNIGIIIGGTIGACLFFSVLALTGFLVWRRRRMQLYPPRGTVSHFSHDYHGPQMAYNSLASPDMSQGDGVDKSWHVQQHGGAVARESDAVPVYPGMRRVGVVEVEGRERPVEVDGGDGGKR